jgi:2',3'-cyclic-nucleotide 2'-phosphodiesterase (5'-nucleotidase family)
MAIATILSLLSGPLGKIVGYAALALAAWGAYELWEYKTEQKALTEFNRRQVEQVLKDKELLLEQLKKNQELTELMQKQLRETNEQLDQKIKVVEDFLNSEEAIKQDRPASPLLKDTIKKLREAQ